MWGHVPSPQGYAYELNMTSARCSWTIFDNHLPVCSLYTFTSMASDENCL